LEDEDELFPAPFSVGEVGPVRKLDDLLDPIAIKEMTAIGNAADTGIQKKYGPCIHDHLKRSSKADFACKALPRSFFCPAVSDR
jgi:hypothetical protein